MNEKRSIMGSVFEYIKRAATPFLLNLMFGLTMFAVALIDITALNAEIERIVAREQVLREEIDKIIAEIEG